jgi:hypothetical protein
MPKKTDNVAAKRFSERKPGFSSMNTRIINDDDYTTMTLFGVTIARQGYEPGAPLEFNTQGWASATTRNRLNALGAKLNIRKGTMYMANGKPVPERTWFTAEMSTAKDEDNG